MFVLSGVNVGIDEDLLQHLSLLLALDFVVAHECIWIELVFVIEGGEICGVAPLLDSCLVHVDTVDCQAVEKAGRFWSLETTIVGVKRVNKLLAQFACRPSFCRVWLQ